MIRPEDGTRQVINQLFAPEKAKAAEQMRCEQHIETAIGVILLLSLLTVAAIYLLKCAFSATHIVVGYLVPGAVCFSAGTVLGVIGAYFGIKILWNYASGKMTLKEIEAKTMDSPGVIDKILSLPASQRDTFINSLESVVLEELIDKVEKRKAAAAVDADMVTKCTSFVAATKTAKDRVANRLEAQWKKREWQERGMSRQETEEQIGFLERADAKTVQVLIKNVLLKDQNSLMFIFAYPVALREEIYKRMSVEHLIRMFDLIGEGCPVTEEFMAQQVLFLGHLEKFMMPEVIDQLLEHKKPLSSRMAGVICSGLLEKAEGEERLRIIMAHYPKVDIRHQALFLKECKGPLEAYLAGDNLPATEIQVPIPSFIPDPDYPARLIMDMDPAVLAVLTKRVAVEYFRENLARI